MKLNDLIPFYFIMVDFGLQHTMPYCAVASCSIRIIALKKEIKKLETTTTTTTTTIMGQQFMRISMLKLQNERLRHLTDLDAVE